MIFFDTIFGLCFAWRKVKTAILFMDTIEGAKIKVDENNIWSKGWKTLTEEDKTRLVTKKKAWIGSQWLASHSASVC